jgi:hypothetical protein
MLLTDVPAAAAVDTPQPIDPSQYFQDPLTRSYRKLDAYENVLLQIQRG